MLKVGQGLALRRALGASITLACATILVAGCETGRTNKAHASWQHLSDETTTSKPTSQQALGPGEHRPPVPGSPTAAGPDGNQPLDDSQALARHSAEHGQEAAPHGQPADSPERRAHP